MLPSRLKVIRHQEDISPSQHTIRSTEHHSANQIHSSPTLPTTSDDDAEDLLTSFLPHLFPDEAPSCLGEPGQALAYESGLWGDVTVIVPDYPKRGEEEDRLGKGGGVEEGRRLFAHYLWGGGLVVAEGIEKATAAQGEKDTIWCVNGERVLELGAGAALPSLISTLAGAAEVTITDHPSSPALYGAIQANVANNIPEHLRCRVSIQPHEWGILNPDEVSSHSKENAALHLHPKITSPFKFALDNKGSFTRIIAADCLWMRNQHENLVRSLLWFLAPPSPYINEKGAREGGVAWVVAGFHTGREVVASFFETAVSNGLVVERIWERDVNARNEEGEVTREWMPVRPREGPENRARWCVVAFLRKGID
ncbi:uncharacterized protein PADG_01472 [Paracoccidioides brasiliensis Pb18]|uniref:Nicotinamide N-methyltransferase n=1 Tax=Paracoccidioides brasiliensis (strain Pb18) TaxID=502780 RepID=C1G3F6_PARBD|nr:uncharacterized protein PADG_01472 [Paracoccidioides brasiliensis Pb18]EEH45322.1 hypothetical protein PADG_01472 [Paracoccidioides brasiliensis Pb18]